MKFYIVDAFTNEAFGGNPAGIVICEGLDSDIMQKIAAELRFSETAFIKRLSGDRFDVKYFTPVSEVDLCGHATVAAFGVLLHQNTVKPDKIYSIETRSGLLEVEVNKTSIMLQQASPALGKEIVELTRLAKILSIDPKEIGDDRHDLLPMTAYTGLWDIMLPVRNRYILDKIDPDFNEMAQLSRELGVVGIHAFALDNTTCTAYCRNFAPLYGIDEEAATGTSNGALTYYLYKAGVIGSCKENNIFIQGEKMKRTSKIITRLVKKDDLSIHVGGSWYILAEGNIII